MLIKNNHISWDDFLSARIRNELEEIESIISKDEYTPSCANVLRFLNLDKEKIKVIILGQDPYYSIANGAKVANGRAFEPNNLNAWSDKFRQVSLKNIVRLIHKNYFNIKEYQDILKFNQILIEIESQKFPLKQPHELFDSWEQQGVLLLNTAFTTELGIANKHSDLWQEFTVELINYLDSENVVWLLWGKNAISYGENLKGKVIKSRHPMMCSSKFEDDFLKSDCFLKTQDLIKWIG